MERCYLHLWWFYFYPKPLIFVCQLVVAKVNVQCSKSRLALGSPGCLFGRHHAQNIFENLIVLYFWKAQGPRTSKLIFPTVKYTNTQIQIQIHKYSFVEVPGIPNICYISKQLLIQGCQKWYSQVTLWPKVKDFPVWKMTQIQKMTEIKINLCYTAKVCSHLLSCSGQLKIGCLIWCRIGCRIGSLWTLGNIIFDILESTAV